jgi:hypothetical protein
MMPKCELMIFRLYVISMSTFLTENVDAITSRTGVGGIESNPGGILE